MGEPKTIGLSDALMEVEADKTDFDKIFELMLKDENLEHNTELNSNEITAFSTLATLAEQYNLQALKLWLVKNLRARVSRGRKGRSEWVKIIGSGISQQQEQYAPNPNRWARWFGKTR